MAAKEEFEAPYFGSEFTEAEKQSWLHAVAVRAGIFRALLSGAIVDVDTRYFREGAEYTPIVLSGLGESEVAQTLSAEGMSFNVNEVISSATSAEEAKRLLSAELTDFAIEAGRRVLRTWRKPLNDFEMRQVMYGLELAINEGEIRTVAGDRSEKGQALIVCKDAFAWAVRAGLPLPPFLNCMKDEWLDNVNEAIAASEEHLENQEFIVADASKLCSKWDGNERVDTPSRTWEQRIRRALNPCAKVVAAESLPCLEFDKRGKGRHLIVGSNLLEWYKMVAPNFRRRERI